MSRIAEIRNYFFVRKVIGKAMKMPEWEKFKLRVNWFGVIYTTISLKEEDMGDEESVRNFKAMMIMQPINEFIAALGSENGDLGIRELIVPSIEYVPGTRTFLITYTPRFEEVTVTWLIMWFLGIAASIATIATLFL